MNHLTALQENNPFYLGFVLLCVIAFGFIYNYNNKNK